MPTHLIGKLSDWDAFAREFVSQNVEGGFFGLRGELGVGKTSFVRSVVQVLCDRAGAQAPRVVSPSYVLHQHYPLSPSVDHWDLYRLENLSMEGLMETGFFDVLSEAQRARGFVFVEWAERLPPETQPDGTLFLTFEGLGRQISY